MGADLFKRIALRARRGLLEPCEFLLARFFALANRLRLRVQRRLVGIGGVAGGVERIIERLELGRDRLAARLGLVALGLVGGFDLRSEEHTSELQSLMRTSSAVLCLKQNTPNHKI